MQNINNLNRTPNFLRNKKKKTKKILVLLKDTQ
jgi:hypothetical protein